MLKLGSSQKHKDYAAQWETIYKIINIVTK